MTKKTLSSDQFLKDIQGKNLNFLIGAGASVGLVNTLDLSQLGESFEDLYSDKQLTSQQRAALDLIWFKSWIQDTLITKEKIDEISAKKPDGKKTFENYKRFVNNLGNFLNREGYDKPKRANIFTTNYDSLFELAFDEVAQNQRMIYFNDGSRGFLNRYISTENFNLNISHSAMSDNFQRSIPTINLLKIHGSITWDLEDQRIKATINNDIFEEVRIAADEIINNIDLKDFPIIDKLFFHKKKLSDAEEKDSLQSLKSELSMFNEYPQDDVFANLNEAPSPKLLEFEKVYSKLQVVNPTKDKFRETVFQQNYYQLLRMLSFELEKRDSVLIVFGFSFADEHILEIVRRSIVNPYLKVYVIYYDKKAKQNLENKLGKVGPNKIEFIPYRDVHDGGDCTTKGGFNYLNYLFDGKSSSEE
ncbi:SIR2 family protein [Lactobacillus helveticus]|uniref:SIR2 family protein n=1 Tax=Lactobacillus helveticus TaxID=1587 RepID=UPI000D7D040C|nr:SIR2 family protein [Lactobacillus helveticus]MCT3408389.1 hypothetical protein [Lactobacillus helveticus]NRO87488.1 hypothetical protein [Lactobacillus helveticus]PXZ20899.1 hypothetical protein DM475_00670 [Lactobacillus helveticus]